ncbi:MAG: hypothetical protein ACF8CQ_18340 [Rhodopirellula sp. JB044]|uniref:hypothetical protein n=1 Tax=Rhodopirellula sp. JB044 TaxID=3342844 RepID=UPI00370CD79D
MPTSMPEQIPEPSRPHWPAMVTSVCVHGAFVALLIWGLATRKHQGTEAEPHARSVGMAVAHRMPDRTRYVIEPEQEKASTAQGAVAAVPSPAAPMSESSNEEASEADASQSGSAGGKSKSKPKSQSGLQPPIDLASILQDMRGTGTGNSNEDGDGVDGAGGPRSLVQGRVRFADGRSIDQLGQSDLVPGAAKLGQGAGRITTELFGVSGTGSTFVYVFDRSESMAAAGKAPLRASKTELIRSLETLTERQQFQIIFYNDSAEVFRSHGDRVGLVLAEEGTIARAKDFVRRTVAIGGTEHGVALRMALRLAPDVIFFLTDAKIQTMSEREMDDITRRAENVGTTIHAIQFGTGPPPTGTFLERLVRRNGGGYRYVDVTTLP